MSSLRLYDLNRRQGYFKDHALTFAKASHDLLVRSHKEAQKRGTERPRLRQYSSIYVRVTADDEAKRTQQIDRLRELIDASVFVFAGGAPRTKTKDSNPIQQFILSYRKIFGLGAFIGLADRDRFELSGEDLEQWLENPARAENILIRNRIKNKPTVDSGPEIGDEKLDDESDGDVEAIEHHSVSPTDAARTLEHPDLFADMASSEEVELSPSPPPKPIDVRVAELTPDDLASVEIEAVLTGLGFEDRALGSNQFLVENISVRKIWAIRYQQEGYAERIVDAWRDVNMVPTEVPYRSGLALFPELDGLAVVDVSGLSKPLIFSAIRRELTQKGRVFVCHAAAENYYPLQVDLENLFSAEQSDDPMIFLEKLSKVLTGEMPPYEDMRLLSESSDPSRARALFAFSSPKHERIFTLLDRREYDYIDIASSNEDTPRARVSRFAADFLSKNYSNARTSLVGTDSLQKLVQHLDDKYWEVYGIGGANIELGLTGSKMQAVAAAVLASRRKIAQAWYISPRRFDENRFSQGVGKIRMYEIRVEDK